MFTNVIFDLDGTLIDTLPLIYFAFNQSVGQVMGREIPPHEIRSWFGPPDQQIIRKHLPDVEAENAIARFQAVYEEEHDRLAVVFPGVGDLVAALRDVGVGIGVVTGKSRKTALISLQRTGLLPYVEFLYAGDDVERQKPDPQAIDLALVDLDQGANDQAVMVGDSAMDVLAGKAAGITTIGVLWGSPDHEELLQSAPDFVCGSVGELHQLLLAQT